MSILWQFNQYSNVIDKQIFLIPNWVVERGQAWFLTGNLHANFDRLIAVLKREYKQKESFSVISFTGQQALYEQELKNDDSDLMDRPDKGTLVREFLTDTSGELPTKWIHKLGIEHLLDQGLRFLSTGETRKVLLLNAILKRPQVLLLDEPYAGLDADSTGLLNELLHEWSQQGLTILLLSRRSSLMPSWITHVAYINEVSLKFSLPIDEARANSDWQQLLRIDRLSFNDLPTNDPLSASPALNSDVPLIALNNINISYGDRPVLKNFSWRVNQGEHWRISGPNGSGKSTLLSVISGDHSQCYSNDVNVFGFRRGSGETIWQIRRYYGLVSGQLHRNYRVSCNVLTVVLSGLFDSIGLYQSVTNLQKNIARHWLAFFDLDNKAHQSFHRLSHGEQRLVLIARALIKQPYLLILDEPCEGLDDVSRQLVLNVINQLAQQNISTLLYVSHDQDDHIPAIKHFLAMSSLN